MVSYEFYQLDPTGGYQIIGILPERRKKSARVTRESIMNWGETIFGKDLAKDIFFIQVTIGENTVRLFQPIPISITPEEISG